MIFLVQFGIHALVNFFKDYKLHLPYGITQFWSSLKKFTPAYLFQIALEIISLPILILMVTLCVFCLVDLYSIFKLLDEDERVLL